MYVRKLKLHNFRNFSDVQFTPSQGCNVFLGRNAQGKTNLLEAVYFLSMGKSHRTSKDGNLIQEGAEYTFVKGGYQRRQTDHQVQIYLDKGCKKIKMDDRPILKLSQLIGNLCCVIFSPEDLRLIKGSPQERRRYMDRCMSQVYPDYFYQLSRYQKSLRMRNAELRNGGKHLDIWDEELSKAGVVLYRHRVDFIRQIQQLIAPVHQQIIPGESIAVTYTVDERLLEQEHYRQRLEDSRKRDLFQLVTNIGPHRDDLVITIDAKDVRQFGSQGQQRTAALSLKLAELRLMEQILGESPILLLDDVMSELDQNRQACLMEMVGGLQSFITTTHLDFAHTGQVMHVRAGKIE